MSSFSPVNSTGIKAATPSPSGTAGRAINDNFALIAGLIADLQAASGTPGPEGQGFTLRGPWDDFTQFHAYDVTTYVGSCYVANVDNIAHRPDTDASWTLIARAGDQGPQGTQGPSGESAPSLEIRGTWDSGQQYGIYDIVNYNGASYVANGDSLNATPDTATSWTLLAAKGDTGPQGDTGPGFVFRGGWDGTQSYQVNDVVTYSGTTYVCTQAVNNSFVSPDNLNGWQLFVSKGDMGDTGPQGIPGNDGAQGPPGSNGTDGSAVNLTQCLTNGNSANSQSIVSLASIGFSDSTTQTTAFPGFPQSLGPIDNVTFQSIAFGTSGGLTNVSTLAFADSTTQTTAYGGVPTLGTVMTQNGDASGLAISNLGGISLSSNGITFPDSSTQTTAWNGSAPTPNITAVLNAGGDAGTYSISNLAGIALTSGSITFPDTTVQTTAALPLTGGVLSGMLTTTNLQLSSLGNPGTSNTLWTDGAALYWNDDGGNPHTITFS